MCLEKSMNSELFWRKSRDRGSIGDALSWKEKKKINVNITQVTNEFTLEKMHPKQRWCNFILVGTNVSFILIGMVHSLRCCYARVVWVACWWLLQVVAAYEATTICSPCVFGGLHVCICRHCTLASLTTHNLAKVLRVIRDHCAKHLTCSHKTPTHACIVFSYIGIPFPCIVVRKPR